MDYARILVVEFGLLDNNLGRYQKDGKTVGLGLNERPWQIQSRMKHHY